MKSINNDKRSKHDSDDVLEMDVEIEMDSSNKNNGDNDNDNNNDNGGNNDPIAIFITGTCSNDKKHCIWAPPQNNFIDELKEQHRIPNDI